MQGAGQKHIQAQSVALAQNDKTSNREMWARVCYYYPQYTLEQASKLPVRDIKLLLHTANKIHAQNMYDLVQIAAAPHTKKGSGVKKLVEHYKKLIS